MPNILFILAILGIVLIILRHLPEAAALDQHPPKESPVEEKLQTKGIPALAISKVQEILKLWISKIWNFILEAKDLRPAAATSYKIKKIFGNRFAPMKHPVSVPASTQEIKNESYLLNIIKKEPKNRANYDALGKFYLENNQLEDAKDIYRYLVKHEPGNPDYHGRLGYCYYQLKDFARAAEHYKQSLGLDSSQPNRYYNLGLSLDALSQFSEAVESFQKAIALEQENSKYYISLSNTYSKMGNNPQAKEQLLKAKELDPNNPIIDKKLEKVS